jgi:hypothetical protein
MNLKKPYKFDYKTLFLWVIFGIGVTFTTTIFVFWIFEGIANPIPMSLVIGALVGVAFKLFSDALNRENKKTKH